MTNLFSLNHLAARAFYAALAALSSISSVAAVSTSNAFPGQSPGAAGLRIAVQKSNGARVVVRYKVAPTTGVGLPATVSLTFSAVTDAAATVRFTSDAGLRLLASQASVALPLGSSALDIQVTPEADGLFYLNVFTTQNGATSAMSIPVAGGGGTPKLDAVGVTKPSAGGQKIISLPVR
jgi:hypothetical protein